MRNRFGLTAAAIPVLAVLFAAACGDTAAGPVEQQNLKSSLQNGAFDGSPSLARAVANQHVTGHANILLPNFQAEQKYSSNAIRHADGSVTGEFQLKSAQDGGLSIHGNVICFTIVLNTARLAGVIERSTEPTIPAGTHVVWTIVDNGEGNNDPPPDQTSDFFGATPGQAQFHCTVGFDLAPLFPVLGGNLQVHP